LLSLPTNIALGKFVLTPKPEGDLEDNSLILSTTTFSRDQPAVNGRFQDHQTLLLKDGGRPHFTTHHVEDKEKKSNAS